MGGSFMVEHLNVFKLVIEKVAKYLLLPGLELDLNLNIRVRGVYAVCVLLSFAVRTILYPSLYSFSWGATGFVPGHPVV
jgi:hypothetical protein